MQEWVKATGAKVCIVFEGRDTAGKGGTIKRITERVSPRVFKVVALSAPTERERSQMYVQRYMRALPGRGRGRHLRPQLVQPRRRRAGHGLLHAGADGAVPRAGAGRREGHGRVRASSCIKYWLEVSPDEQTRRLEGRINDPRKVWKLTDMDLKSYSRWYDYSRARDAMLAATDTPGRRGTSPTPMTRNAARLNIISHLLSAGAVRAAQAA